MLSHVLFAAALAQAHPAAAPPPAHAPGRPAVVAPTPKAILTACLLQAKPQAYDTKRVTFVATLIALARDSVPRNQFILADNAVGECPIKPLYDQPSKGDELGALAHYGRPARVRVSGQFLRHAVRQGGPRGAVSVTYELKNWTVSRG